MSFQRLLICFIRYNKRWSCQALAFMIFIFYIGVSNLKMHLDADAKISYAIARSFGSILKWFVLSIIPPISRVIFTKIRNSYLGRCVGLDRRIADHKLFAFGASAAAVIHMLAHYIYNPQNFYRQPGITGLIMLSSLAVPLFGVFLARRCFSCIQKYSYSAQVLRPHQLGAAVFILAYAYHVPDGRLFNFAFAMYSLYLLDRILEYKYIHTTRILEATKIQNRHAQSLRSFQNPNYIMLTLERPPHFGDIQPGQYALLSLPQIDAFFECWHPFTISSFDASKITFLIQRVGPWTKRLAKFLFDDQKSLQSLQSQEISINGPYGSTLNNFNNYQSMTFIGTGIGVTPFLSYLNYIFSHEHLKMKRIPNLDLHFVQRTAEDLIPCIQALKTMPLSYVSRINVHLYVTGVVTEVVTGIVTQIESNIPDDVTVCINPVKELSLRGKRWFIYTHKPDFETIVKESNIVAVCGNPCVIKTVSALALKHDKRCLKETF